MIDRRLAGELRQRLGFYPGAVLPGPRQVGKTTLGRQIASEHLGEVVLDLERPSDRARLGVGVPPETLHRFWRMLVHLHGQLFSAAQSGGALGGVPHTTVARYLDIMSI